MPISNTVVTTKLTKFAKFSGMKLAEYLINIAGINEYIINKGARQNTPFIVWNIKVKILQVGSIILFELITLCVVMRDNPNIRKIDPSPHHGSYAVMFDMFALISAKFVALDMTGLIAIKTGIASIRNLNAEFWSVIHSSIASFIEAIFSPYI